VRQWLGGGAGEGSLAEVAAVGQRRRADEGAEGALVIEAAVERDRGGAVWYLMAKDEGRGFAKKKNADFQLISIILYFREFLVKQSVVSGGWSIVLAEISRHWNCASALTPR